MRAKAMPGEDPTTLDTPEQAAETIVPLCLSSCEETGMIFNYPNRKFLTFNAPA
jgi:hypothetical protein